MRTCVHCTEQTDDQELVEADGVWVVQCNRCHHCTLPEVQMNYEDPALPPGKTTVAALKAVLVEAMATVRRLEARVADLERNQRHNKAK